MAVDAGLELVVVRLVTTIKDLFWPKETSPDGSLMNAFEKYKTGTNELVKSRAAMDRAVDR